MAITGKGGAVKVGAVTVSELKSWKLDVQSDMKEKTNFASSGWKEYVSASKSWTCSCDGTWNIATDTTGQKAFQDALLNGTTVSLSLSLNGTNNYTGTAYVKKITVDEPVDDIVKFQVDFEGTGAVAYA